MRCKLHGRSVMNRILNFGSLNIDCVYRVPHFVRPGETLSSLSYEKIPGGKGLNQSVALAKAGCEVYHAGKVGPDGELLLQVLKQSGADCRYVKTDGTVSGHAIIQVEDGGQNCILLYGGANEEISVADVDAVLADFSAGDYLLLQNEISCVEYLAASAAKRGMRVVLNPSPIKENLKRIDLKGLYALIMNETEGRELTGESDPLAVLRVLQSRAPHLCTVLTLGSDGAWYQDENTQCFQPSFKVQAVDTTAAGDTFTGYLLYGMCTGMAPKDSMRLAAKASSIAVTRKGASVSIPAKSEVL